MQSNAEAIEAVSALFDSFEPEYQGHQACTDARGRPTGRHTWQFSVSGETLTISTDQAFPYSRPNAYIVGYDAARDLPHVELDGRLCLTKVEMSADPAESARQVLAEALELLEAHEKGVEDDDLKEDFSNYWSQREYGGGPCLSLLYEEGAKLGAYVTTNDEIFAFASKRSMLNWWENRTGTAPRHRNAAHFIELNRLPHPSAFPADGAGLMDFLGRFSDDGGESMVKALSAVPNATLFVLVGRSPSGRHQFAGIRLVKVQPPQKNGSRRMPRLKLGYGDRVEPEKLLSHYKLQRLRTTRLDSASTRAVLDIENLATKKVIIVGCGALGSGVIRMLAKAGIGSLELVDGELLGWENVRRHELGGASVRLAKSEALADTIKRDLPEIREVMAHRRTIQEVVLSGAKVFDGADLIVACTGSLHAERYIDILCRSVKPRVPVVYGWMEAWGAAAHGILLKGAQSSLMDGFDDGIFRSPASRNDRDPPKECGNSTTPFGATEAAAAQVMIADLCLEALLDSAIGDTWRTCWTSERHLTRAGGSWTEEFQAAKPQTSQSGVMERSWP